MMLDSSLDKTSVFYLSYVLARCGMPVEAGNVLRRLLEADHYPNAKLWIAILAHVCRTEQGSFLAAELVGEFAYRFNDNRVDPRKKANKPLLSMKPNAQAFTMVLTACLLSGLTKKAEDLLEWMPRIGLKPDADLLIVMAHVYERNGRLVEIKKLKRFVNEDPCVSHLQFQQFYVCLLSCHLMFGDLDSATAIVLDMLKKAKEAKTSFRAATTIIGVVHGVSNKVDGYHITENGNPTSLDKLERFIKQPPSFEEFSKDADFLKLGHEAKNIIQGMQSRMQAKAQLVKSEHGILYPTEKIYAKLVRSFLEADRMADLAKFLIDASKLDTLVSNDKSVVVQVINACVLLRLLDQAHDLIDEMRFHGVRIGSSVYVSLLKAYCKDSRLGEVKALLKDARKAGIQLDSSCYDALIQSHADHKDLASALSLFKEMNDSNVTRSSHRDFEMVVEESNNGKSDEATLMTTLLEEIKEDRKVDCGVHDWNSAIHFFCKKRMMQDAHKSLDKMRALGHTPNSQTFHSLITAYAALGGRYTEATDLWGEMKALSKKCSLKFDQELLDSLLYCFVRGGFFLRANEVIAMMERDTMFIDKYKYRTIWLKYHKTLYKGKTPKVQTEAQCVRREAALSFKKWINLM